MGCASGGNGESVPHMTNVEQIREALKQVKYPGFSRDIVSFGLVKGVEMDGADVTVRIEIATKDPKVPQQVFQDVHAVLDGMDGVGAVKVDILVKDAPEAAGTGKSRAALEKLHFAAEKYPGMRGLILRPSMARMAWR